jgi:peptidoglycan/xylan/chitin deacetylase (PgdA/CDA1 family)
MKKLFYILKPLIPRSLQIYLRRKLVIRQREKFKDTWPVLLSSAKKPVNWQGWLNNKKFAFILTHDVESIDGHDKCKELMQIEKDLNFVSSYNFVPEKYNVSSELRKYLEDNGFEVGVHGLNHDGKLFSSKSIFNARSKNINKYIKEWGAVGFRAPAMHHNLEWIKQLDIEYDLSTFDTDPFEPQSDGVGTIFPFIVERENKQNGYAELPYTLVQDFTLFILMKEKDISIWKEKIDWIADNGGMVLVNVHPDYVNLNNNPKMEEFPLELYIDLLKYVKTKYGGKYWNDIPRNVATFVKKSMAKSSENKMMEAAN